VIQVIPETNKSAAHWTRLFARPGPIHVDLGCGDGLHLAALGAQYPEKNFLGIERLLHRARSAVRKTSHLENIGVLRADTSFVVRHLFPAESIQAFYLLFPDPWPKRRHHRRRIVTSEFLMDLAQALAPSGSLFVATDHSEYFERILQLATESNLFCVADQPPDWEFPKSTFEQRFRDAGIPIHRLELRKVSPVTKALASQDPSRNRISTAPVSS
jgi:tRNA (guanine-N7-)-methyltransferase